MTSLKILLPCLCTSMFLVFFGYVPPPLLASGANRATDDEQLYEQANTAFSQKKFTEAVSMFSRLIDAGYKVDDSYRLRATARAELGDLSGAGADYQKAIDINPGNFRAWSNRCWMKRVKLKDLTGAIPDCDQAIKLSPENHFAYTCRGQARHDLKDYDGAVADYSTAIRIDPNKPSPYVNRGSINTLKKRWPEALTDLDIAIELDPGNDFPYPLRATVRAKMDDYAGAIADLEHVQANKPNDVKIAAEINRLQTLQAQKPKSAADRKNSSPEAFAGKWNSNFGMLELKIQGHKVTGTYPHKQGRVEGVISSDGRTLEGTWGQAPGYKPPKESGRYVFHLSPDGNRLEGQWFYGQTSQGGDWNAVRLPAPKPDYLVKAMALAEEAENKKSGDLLFKALETAESATASDPGQPAAWYLMGYLYTRIQQDHLAGVLAEEALKKAVKLDPKLTKARLLLADLQLERDSYDLALTNLEEALRQDSALIQPEITAGMCRAYIADLQVKRGEKFFRELTAAHPDADSARLAGAILLNETEAQPEAVAELHKIVNQSTAKAENRDYARTLLDAWAGDNVSKH